MKRKKQLTTNASIDRFFAGDVGSGGRKMSAFGVSRKTQGMRAGKRERKMGLHASDTSQLVMEECRVAATDLIGTEGNAFNDVKKVLDKGRIGIGALAIGLGRASLEIAISYAKE